jgi:hypothetical protein
MISQGLAMARHLPLHVQQADYATLQWHKHASMPSA